MAVIGAAVVPHAPLLALGRASATAAAARAVLSALSGDAPWILLSPHGSRTAVRPTARGSLAAFGVAHEGAAAPSDPALVAALGAGWREEAPPDPADQGVTVPLMLLEQERVVVPVTFAEVTGPAAAPVEEALGDAKEAGDAIAELAEGRDIVLVASAHTAASLSPRGPLLEGGEGHALHDAIVSSLRTGAGMEQIPAELWRAAGSCGAAPLSVLARVCSGWSFEVTSEDAPFGVGYVCALSIP